MKRFDGKVRLFCISNIMVSFIGTGFLGINGYSEAIEGPVLSAHEISLASSDTEPASQYGEGEDNIYALITEGIKAMIEQQEDALEQDDVEEEKEEKKEETTKKSEVKKKDVKTGNTKKTTAKKTTTKKTTSTKTTSTKKSSSKSSTYTYNGTATGSAIVSYAKQFIGLRYSSGKQSLKSGADCSGFTMLIFKKFGISLPRSVRDQAKKGYGVDKKNLQLGDLVFFRPKGCSSCGVSHVSIYIGGGKIIHETRPGRGVAITSIDGLSNITYVKARRVITSKTAKVAETKSQEQNKTVTDNSSKTNTSTQENKNEGNVNNNVATNATTTNTTENKVVATPTATPVATAKPTATPVAVKQETKVEVKVENVEPKEESSSNGQ